jgi:hypothetical protein
MGDKEIIPTAINLSKSPGETPAQKDEVISAAIELIQLMTGTGVAIFNGLGNWMDNPARAAGNLIGTVGRLVQSAVAGNFTQEIIQDLKKLKESGDLLETRLSDDATDALTEVLEFIDSIKTRDAEKLKAVRMLFKKSIRISTPEADRLLAKEFLKISKKLEGIDFLTLKACYELRKEKSVYAGDASMWAGRVAEKMGHGIQSMVFAREESLVGACLWGKRTHADLSGIANKSDFRLTDLGLKFCKFLEEENP